jgi:hypothetical protein
MLHCKNFRQFIFVMTVIMMANSCGFLDFSPSWARSLHPRGEGFFNPGFQARATMATVIQHRKVNIVVLDAGEAIAACCGPGDIAIVAQTDGWWNSFIDRSGAVHGYDRPYASYNEALWAAKAAAEYGVD